MKCDNATIDYKRMIRKHEDNKDILKMINYIQRTAAKVDSYNPLGGIRQSNLRQTHINRARTEKENKLLHTKLQLIVSLNL